MFVLVVLYVLVMFLYYISIYLGSTRVLAYCSGVQRLPPENYEGENEREKKDRARFCSVLLDCLTSAFPI